MNKPHKHADVIKAWADGASIEVRDPFNPRSEWRTINPPRWADNLEYRVKPETKLVPFTFEDADKIIGKVVKGKILGNIFLIICVTRRDTVKLGNKTNSISANLRLRPVWNYGPSVNPVLCSGRGGTWTHLNDLLSYYVFLDGSPCGKTVNE